MNTKRRCQRKSKHRKNEELSAATVEKLLKEAHRRVEALVEIQFFDFFIIFFVFFSDFVSQKKEAHQILAQLEAWCGLEKFAKS
jgi:hypothetical protein